VNQFASFLIKSSFHSRYDVNNCIYLSTANLTRQWTVRLVGCGDFGGFVRRNSPFSLF
jgi:hypothetical protein